MPLTEPHTNIQSKINSPKVPRDNATCHLVPHSAHKGRIATSAADTKSGAHTYTTPHTQITIWMDTTSTPHYY